MSRLNLLGIVGNGREEVKFHFEEMDLGEKSPKNHYLWFLKFQKQHGTQIFSGNLMLKDIFRNEARIDFYTVERVI